MRLATLFTVALLAVVVGGESVEDQGSPTASFPTPPPDDALCTRQLVTCEEKLEKLVTVRERLINESISLTYRENALVNEKIGLERSIKMLRHLIENPNGPTLDVPRGIACAFPGRVGYVASLSGGPCRGLLAGCRRRSLDEGRRVREKKAGVKEQRRRIREAKGVNKGLKKTVQDLRQQLAAMVTENLSVVIVAVATSPAPTAQKQKHPNDIQE